MARGLAVVAAGAVLSGAGFTGMSAASPLVRGAQQWVTLYRGPGGTDAVPSSVAVSPGGAIVFVTGTIARAGAAVFAGSIVTAAYRAATGTQLWASSYRGPGNGFDAAASIAVSGGKVFVTGSSAAGPGLPRNFATIAYNAATGAQLWASSFGGRHSDSGAASVAVSPRGSRVFVTGCAAGAGSGAADYTTVSYDAATGARLWASNYDGGGGHTSGCATSVAVGPHGGRVFVTGDLDNDFGTVAYNAATGTQLWARRYPSDLDPADNPIGTVFVAVSGGRVLVSGTAYRSGAIGYGTVAYSVSTGAQLWAKHYGLGSDSLTTPSSLAVGGDEVFVTGTSFGAGPVSDYATVAYNIATGAEMWVRRYHGHLSLRNAAASVAVSPGGRTVYVTGTSVTRANGGDYATIAYVAATGAQLWARRYLGRVSHGGFGNVASSVAVSRRTGQVFVTGTRYAPVKGGIYPASAYATIAYRG